MKKKRLYRKLGSHESPVHSRNDALRVKRTCEQYVRNLQFMHERAVAHLQAENKRLESIAESKHSNPILHIESSRLKSACKDMMIDERFNGSVPVFSIACQRFSAPESVGSGISTYRLRLDYDGAVPPFTRENCMIIVDSIQHLFHFVTKGNY